MKQPLTVPTWRAAAPAAGLAAALACAACSTLECDPDDETKEALRSVPVHHAVDANLPASVRLGDGESIHRQTYSITPEGKFKFHRSADVEVGFLGAQFAALAGDQAKKSGAEPFSGVVVESLEEDGPAARGGLRQRDIIQAFAGKPVSSPDQLQYWIEQAKPWTQVSLKIERDGAVQHLEVEVGREVRIASTRILEKDLRIADDYTRAGLKLAELTEDVRPMVLGPEGGPGGLIVVQILPGGPAFFSNLRLLDHVVSASGKPLATIEDYWRATEGTKAGQRVEFTAMRAGRKVEAPVKLVRNALSSGGVDFLGLIKSEQSPARREFRLIWGIALDADTCCSIKEKNGKTEHVVERSWGAALDLIAYKETPRKTELRLLWLFPIAFRKE
jgi:hypothetical protein